jgi:hypothetical protein
MDSYVASTRQKYWSDRRRRWCTQVKTMSSNTIRMVLGTEFDLTIAQNQIKDWNDSISKEEILSCFNTNKTRYPLRRNNSDRAFVFQLSKLLFKLNQLVQGITYRFLEKRAIQRTSLLMNLTTRSCENMAILLERHPEYHNHRYVTKFKRESCFTREVMWSWEFWHEPNSLTKDVCLNYELGNTMKKNFA